MRHLKRNQRAFWVATPGEPEPIFDEEGRFTGQYTSGLSEPRQVFGHITPTAGSIYNNPFGRLEGYDRLILMGTRELTETDKIWIDRSTTEKPDYVVVRIADGLNGFVYAIKKEDGQS